MERFLVQTEVQMGKNPKQCWTHLFPSKLNDQHEVAHIDTNEVLYFVANKFSVKESTDSSEI